MSSWKNYLKEKQKQFAKELYAILFCELTFVFLLILGFMALPNHLDLIGLSCGLVCLVLGGWVIGWLYTLKKLWRAT